MEEFNEREKWKGSRSEEKGRLVKYERGEIKENKVDKRMGGGKRGGEGVCGRARTKRERKYGLEKEGENGRREGGGGKIGRRWGRRERGS